MIQLSNSMHGNKRTWAVLVTSMYLDLRPNLSPHRSSPIPRPTSLLYLANLKRGSLRIRFILGRNYSVKVPKFNLGSHKLLKARHRPLRAQRQHTQPNTTLVRPHNGISKPSCPYNKHSNHHPDSRSSLHLLVEPSTLVVRYSNSMLKRRRHLPISNPFLRLRSQCDLATISSLAVVSSATYAPHA